TNLSNASDFRTPAANIPGVTQEMVNDPNSVLRDAIKNQNIVSHIEIKISTSTAAVHPPSEGGGISNIAFLQGADRKPNAEAAQMDASFWIEIIEDGGGAQSLQLQYSQLVLLNFNQLSWPHVSVATLVFQKSK